MWPRGFSPVESICALGLMNASLENFEGLFVTAIFGLRYIRKDGSEREAEACLWERLCMALSRSPSALARAALEVGESSTSWSGDWLRIAQDLARDDDCWARLDERWGCFRRVSWLVGGVTNCVGGGRDS